MKATFTLTSPHVADRAIEAIRAIAPDGSHEVTIREYKATRSTMQNRRLWAMLTDIANQVVWHGRKLSPENWKDIFTASLKHQDVVPGLDNNFVVLGTSTSKMKVAEMCDLQELMSAFGAQQGVRFTYKE